MSKNGDSWHFHILSPECTFNTQKQYALILENTTTKSTFVYYSDTPILDVGKDLVQLLHGRDVVKKKADVKLPSPAVANILTKAKTLAAQNTFWHHHVLFPDCQFNPHPGQWTIIFEDQESG